MFISSIILGLLSSLHCIGMCGPIALMLPVDRTNVTKKTFQIILYHLGRLSSYGLLGLIFGFFGRSLYLAGFQQQLSIVIGMLMVILAITPERTLAKYNFSKPIYIFISKIKSSLGSQFKSRKTRSFYIIGLLNGLLPCALLYVALFGATAMQDPFLSCLFMIFYGLGTIPLMSLMVIFGNLIKSKLPSSANKVIPFVTFTLGVLFILKGLGLDIPMLSPSNLQLFITSQPNCGF